MSNEVKQEAPERITISNGFGVWQTYGSWKTSSYSGDNVVVEYVRADLLATVRREEREAAFKDAIAIVMQRGEILHRGNLVAALEASVDSEKGEGNGSDQTTKET